MFAEHAEHINTAGESWDGYNDKLAWPVFQEFSRRAEAVAVGNGFLCILLASGEVTCIGRKGQAPWFSVVCLKSVGEEEIYIWRLSGAHLVPQVKTMLASSGSIAVALLLALPMAGS